MTERTNQGMAWNGLDERKTLEIDLINIPKYCVTSLYMLFNLHAWCTYAIAIAVAAIAIATVCSNTWIVPQCNHALLASWLAGLLRKLGKKRYRNFVSCVKMSVRGWRERHANGWMGGRTREREENSELRWPTVNSMIARILKRSTNACASVRVWGVAVVSLFGIAFICYALFEGLRCYCCWEHKKATCHMAIALSFPERKNTSTTRVTRATHRLFLLLLTLSLFRMNSCSYCKCRAKWTIFKQPTKQCRT